jgi:hypothetical protein
MSSVCTVQFFYHATLVILSLGLMQNEQHKYYCTACLLLVTRSKIYRIDS